MTSGIQFVAAVKAASSTGPSGVIATLNSLVGGSGYNTLPSTYNVTLTGGTGSGATATVTVGGGGTVTAITIVNGGTGYVVGDVLGLSGGGSGSGFSVHVATLAAPGVANISGTFANQNNGPGDTITSTSGAAFSVDGYTPVVGDRLLLKNQTAGLQNGVWVLTQAPVAGEVATFGTIVQPTGGTLKNGLYQGVALTGGTGSGATALVQVTSGAVAYVAIQNPGTGYAVNDVLTFNSNGGGFGNGGTIKVATVTTGTYAGAILTTNTLTQPTSDFVCNGSYFNFPLTGGTGSGATANITISGGQITSIVLVNPGVGYVANDVLGFSGTSGTPTAGLGTGGTVAVSTVTFVPAVLTRSADASSAVQVAGLGVWVVGGSTNANTAWVQNQLTVTMDTTALTFVELVA